VITQIVFNWMRPSLTRRPIHAIAAAALLLAGCSLQPVYERPAPPIASAYPTSPAYKQLSSDKTFAAADTGWRDLLPDPRLQRLVEIALANNRDLRVAALNIAQAQAQYRIQRSAMLPQVNAGVSSSAVRAPLPPLTGENVTTHDYAVGLAASWEIDFFGRLRSLNDQALQQYFATAQAHKATQLALVAAVANQYLTILADDELLAVTQNTLETAEASYKLTLLQFNGGTGTQLAVRQAETVVEQAKANHAAQLRARAQAENALVLLLGQSLPSDLPPAVALNAQSIIADIPADLPSDLLTRRPDIMEAEAVLLAANANIGAARAAFFPTISLTGSGGLESAALSSLFRGASLAWSFAPSLVVPIFQGGKLQANLDIATVQKDIRVAQYEKAIQTAFREVADGLAARGTYDDQVASLARYTLAYQGYLDLAQQRFQNGVDTYLDVLTAQTNLYNAQQQLVSARLARLTTLVDLYRGLGGGWIERTGDSPRSASASRSYR
jgi:multidrug efflux system outer membrane protein